MGGPIVLADKSDNAGGGAPGDSTFLIDAMRKKGIGNVAPGPLWDPIAVATCFDAGEGASSRRQLAIAYRRSASAVTRIWPARSTMCSSSA
jgi:microcystin degradation protein MlrC